ncbi:MAG TPA: thiosulfate oxidation carrier protein SoxY [Methylomirabilota bacterium]|nr:thiosulfate oxidation carrier protein SoxY [Methylomirabilota bacterium]
MTDPTLVLRSPAVSRRGFLRLAGAAAGLVGPALWRPVSAGPAPMEAPHRPLLRLPPVTSNGARVPITVEMAHPMEPDHHVTTLTVVNPRDPVPLKGVFHFSPANGLAYVAFQARLDEGSSTVLASADCGLHGRFTASAPVTIAAGSGGCAGGPPVAAFLDDEIRPPVIRIPRLVADGQIAPGEIVDVQVKTRHPSRTGLVVRNSAFVQAAEPFHLRELDVFYDAERVSHFVLSAALSDNPFIAFKLRARHEATVRVTLTNTRGQRFEATHRLRLG